MKGQGSLEYLLILAAVLAIAIVVIIVGNSLVTAPEQSTVISKDKFEASFDGVTFAGYNKAFDPNDVNTWPDAINYEGETYPLVEGTPSGPVIAVITGPDGIEYPIYIVGGTSVIGDPIGSCSDECTVAEQSCYGTSYQVCGDFDVDTCLEFSNPVSCNAGYNCVGTSCELAADTIPPSAPGTIVPGSVTSSLVELFWGAATDNVAVASYNVYRDTVLIGSTAALTYQDTTVSASTSYDYEIKAVDTSANEGPGVTTTILTPAAPPDTTPPSVPGTLVVDGFTSTTVDLSWGAATDNVAVDFYNVYRDTVLIGSPAVLTYQDAGLIPSTAYSYYVRAVDTSTNEGPLSNTVNPSTTAGLTLVKECPTGISGMNTEFIEKIVMINSLSNVARVSLNFGNVPTAPATAPVSIDFIHKAVGGATLSTQTIVAECSLQQWCDFDLTPISFAAGEALWIDLITSVSPYGGTFNNCDDPNFNVDIYLPPAFTTYATGSLKTQIYTN